MIRRLQRKFILISMTLVSLVLLIVFAALLISTYHNQQREIHSILRQTLLLSDRLDSVPLNQDPFRNLPEELEDRVFSPAFSLTADESGAVLEIHSSFIDISQETAENILRSVLDYARTEGKLPELGLQYLCSPPKEDGTYQIAFVELSNYQAAMRRLLLTSAAAGAGGLAAFFLISLFLSRIAVAPVRKAWLQQRQFVANASHELKTPITVILADARILASHPSDTVQSQRKWIESVQEEGERMKRLVEDMLFLARTDAAGGEPEKTWLSFSDLALNSLLPFESIAFEKGLTLEEDIACGLYLYGNEKQLAQLVGILLDNACKYTGTGGMIFLSLHQNQDRIFLTVQNSGEPIPKEAFPHLFERFYRVDQARSRASGGYGLGLSIAQSIVKHHGGKIRAESSEEKGNRFTVEFPADTRKRVRKKEKSEKERK